MLLELRIQNFAVIEQLSLQLDRGLNVLSGETGAGKSIIVGALSLLLGERASAESVRTGASKAIVEGVFDVAAQPAVLQLLVEQGIDADEGLLILRREVSAAGRSRAWVNGAASTATLLSELGRWLVDLHGQHEHQTLLHAQEQRLVLDAFAGAHEEADAVRRAYQRWQQAQARLRELEQRRREAEQRADYLRFQVAEIQAARPRVEEEAELHIESQRLEHADELARLANRLHTTLYADDRSITATLGELRRVLEQLLRIDDSQQSARELLDNGYYALEELGRRMGEYASQVEPDPKRLAQVRHRLDVLHRLTAKYGPGLADVLATLARAQEELSLMEGADDARNELQVERDTAHAELQASAGRLSRLRQEAALRLGREVEAVLPELGMPGARFAVELAPMPDITAQGAELVHFRVALNTGLETRELARIASGGELSRIMLALKTILARLDQVPTLVFDEIDAGIGGRVALQVAARLRQVAEHHQVFVITHLPQIASRARQHLHVEKVEQDGSTLTRVYALAEEERVREVARMLGGDPESSVSLQHARELIASA